jgi:hypothetical protein
MKYHRLRFAVWTCFALVLSGVTTSAQAAPAPSDEGVPLDIDVRSTVDQRWNGASKLGATAHGKVYYLAAVREAPAAEKLARPVDKEALTAQLRQELTAQGFREIATAEEKPDVVLTVSYGRGFLRNPYLADAQVDDISSGTAVSTITTSKQVLLQREHGYEAKLQKAQFEKLFIAVTAWQLPATKGEKPKELWKTVMVVDNPDNRDLNLAMPAMLKAGVAYFDRDLKEPEVTINSTVPSGTVIIGPLNVIEMGKEKDIKK